MRTDILVDENKDLMISQGDFDLGISDSQHVEHIAIAQKGEFKEFPFAGFGIENYLKTNTNEFAFKRDFKIQLEYDGYKNANITLDENYQLKINMQ